MTKIIIRDFDGPIIDSKESAFAFYKNNYLWFTDETVKRLFDGNFFQEFKNITWKDFSIDATLTKNDYETFLLTMNAVEWVQDIIHEFQEKWYKQYIITSNIADLTEFLNNEGIYGCFAKILDGNKERSKIKKFHMVHEKEWWAISDYFFITDTVGDVKEAVEAWIPRNHIYAVTRGYHDRERLEQIEWISLVDKVEELATI